MWIVKLDQKEIKLFIHHSKDEWKSLKDYAAYTALAGINLNMFHDRENSAGYTKAKGEVLQPKVNPKYNAFLVWNKDTTRIISRFDKDFGKVFEFPNISQNIRMIDDKDIKWQTSQKKWSVSALGMDSQGNILFIHSRHPWTMRKFCEHLLSMPLDIVDLIYLEGGSEAQIYAKGGHNKAKEHFRVGSYETGVWPYHNNYHAWKLPFVLLAGFR